MYRRKWLHDRAGKTEISCNFGKLNCKAVEALKTKGVAHKGILSVRVPKEFEDKELEVIILSADVSPEENNEEKTPVEKVKRLLSIVGKAKYPDFPITKYNVYEQ